MNSMSISGCSPTTNGWRAGGDGEYVPLEKRAIRASMTIVSDFAPYLSGACQKIVGASSDAAMLQRCEQAMQQAVGAHATAIRSQRTCT